MNLVLRDNALRFSRSTDVLAVEHISEPLICGHRPERERSQFALVLLTVGIRIGSRHTLTLSCSGTKRNNSSLLLLLDDGDGSAGAAVYYYVGAVSGEEAVADYR